MTTSKLPARPSLESLRKQAKKLARGIVVGHASAIARARAQLPQAELPLSQRDAQLVLAREYGFPGWQDLVREVKQRLGRGLEWVVAPSVCDGLIASRTKGLLDLFHRRGLLPQSLRFFAALGDVNGVRACLDANGDDLAAVNKAFMCACHLQHATAAALLLDRSITLDAELGRQIDGGPGRSAFVQYIMAESETLAFTNADPAGPWQAFVMRQVVRAVNDGDLTSFVGGLRGGAWMLGDG